MLGAPTTMVLPSMFSVTALPTWLPFMAPVTLSWAVGVLLSAQPPPLVKTYAAPGLVTGEALLGAPATIVLPSPLSATAYPRMSLFIAPALDRVASGAVVLPQVFPGLTKTRTDPHAAIQVGLLIGSLGPPATMVSPLGLTATAEPRFPSAPITVRMAVGSVLEAQPPPGLA